MSESAEPRFQIERRAQFSDTDAAGIVHFSNFFRWMEEIEHAFFRSLGFSVSMHDDDGRHISWPRVSASCDYRAPIKFEQVVSLQLHIERLGEKSLNYRVDFVSEGKTLAVGKITSVCCEISSAGMRGIAIPPEMRAKLEG